MQEEDTMSEVRIKGAVNIEVQGCKLVVVQYLR